MRALGGIDRKWTMENVLLRPLRFLKRAHLEVKSRSSHGRGSDIAVQVMSAEPAIDLELLCDGISTYCRSVLVGAGIPPKRFDSEQEAYDYYPDDHIVGRLYDRPFAGATCELVGLINQDLPRCRERDDVEGFLRLRRQALRVVKFIILKRQETVFEGDPEDWNEQMLLSSAPSNMIDPPAANDISHSAKFERRWFYATVSGSQAE